VQCGPQRSRARRTSARRSEPLRARTALREFREKEWRPTSPDLANRVSMVCSLSSGTCQQWCEVALHTAQVQCGTARWRAFGLLPRRAPFYNASNLQPCILLVSPRFLSSVLLGGQIGVSAGGRSHPEARSCAAWIIDRPPALLSDAVENPRPHEPAFTRSAREVAQGRGAGTQSNPNPQESR
jgi:hypothetical protein